MGLSFGLPTLLGYMLDGVLGAWAGLLIGGVARLVAGPTAHFYQQPLPLHWRLSHILLQLCP